MTVNNMKPKESNDSTLADSARDSKSQHSQSEQKNDISMFSVVLSVLQASFGVQNKKNRERDFGKGSLLPFAITAIVFTGLFVLALILIVQLVLP